jgi:hypothetical protein
MTRTLRQKSSTRVDVADEVPILDDQGKNFSFADLEPMSEDERRRLGFPFDVPDEFNEAEANWIHQKRKSGKPAER